MTQYSIWTSYTGADVWTLAVVMVVIAALLIGVGLLVRRPLAARAGGRVGGLFVYIWWGLSIMMMLYATIAYGYAINQQNTEKAVQPANPITRFTLLFALAAFVLVFIWTRKRHGWKIALVSGVAGAGAGPVMFEFAFDWIIMWHLATPYPVGLYRWLYFIPLFSFIFATLAMLTLTPAARLRRETFFTLAAMFVIWAGWAVFAGFGYPGSPVPLVFNVVSKFVAAVAGVTIFLPPRKGELVVGG